jgi:LuxR family maltose regulon positive regulatory protein
VGRRYDGRGERQLSPPVPPPPSRPIVLESKLHPADGRPGEVVRERLLDQIISSPARLVIVNAPAGSGKTTLINQCAAAVQQPVAWLSLDQTDNDAAVLLAELATAIDRIVTLDPSAFTRPRTIQGSINSELIAELLNALEQASGLVLVLDDVHVLRSAASADVLTQLCEHLPRTVRLILTSREAPQLPLGRPRPARGRRSQARVRRLRHGVRAHGGVGRRTLPRGPRQPGSVKPEPRGTRVWG